MPKRSKANKVWNSEGAAGKGYYEHDDRVNDSIRRVSFKPGSNHIGKQRNRGLELPVRSRIEDGDVDMTTPGSNGRSMRYNPYFGRSRIQTGSGNTGGRGSGGRRRSGRASPSLPHHLNRIKLPDNIPSWYKVYIPHGGRYSKEYILKSLLDAIAPTVFIPLKYDVRGADSSFFVDDSRTADRLAAVDRKITTFKGFKLMVRVKPDFPHVELNSTLKEKIKAAMVKRYNVDLKALDLSRFHADPDLVDIYAVALFRPNMMLAVLDIIVENVPELMALDLSDNKLYALDNLSVLSVKLPNLRVLHIGKNRIRDIHQLDRLEGLRLEDLVLDGNPLCDKYQDQNVYIRKVHSVRA